MYSRPIVNAGIGTAVAGAPASLFTGTTIDKAKFHLLPITEAPLLATYTPSRIEAGT